MTKINKALTQVNATNKVFVHRRIDRIRIASMFFLFVLVINACTRQNEENESHCKVCDRIIFFGEVKERTAREFWPAFNTDSLIAPLLYFDDSLSWLAFSDRTLLPNASFREIACDGDLTLLVTGRLDSVPFHMENKMDFKKTTSPYYYRPVMFCSDTETAMKLIPEVKGTEEWLQMVMHEYFHAFQFNHKEYITYLADSVAIRVDSLHNIYRSNEWFKGEVTLENNYLLKAIMTTGQDSTTYYQNKFIATRAERRKRFKANFNYDIAPTEKFWEKTEGTARYIEYHTGFIFADKGYKSTFDCDSLFNKFQGFKGRDFTQDPWSKEKTEMMVAYYYVTGFNLARLLDKMGINYKADMFIHPEKALENYLMTK